MHSKRDNLNLVTSELQVSRWIDEIKWQNYTFTMAYVLNASFGVLGPFNLIDFYHSNKFSC